MDNDPENKSVDPSNRDSNKGIVSNRYQPYDQLLGSIKELNQRSYGWWNSSIICLGAQ